MSKLGSDALAYSASFGWCVIPVAGKKALFPWKRFQTDPPSKEEYLEMFGGKETGIAVVTGHVSDGLVVRDFDTVDSYERWAKEFPVLASRLPTSRTSRGFHVYGRSSEEECGPKKLEDGEIRFGRSIAVLPPSVHESGCSYAWAIPPIHAVPPVTLEYLEINQLLEATTTQGTQESHVLTTEIDPALGLLIEQAIKSTLPTGKGQRHHKVFELCRALRAFLPSDTDREFLKPIVRQWHARASGTIKTKEFGTTWLDFANGWKDVRVPRGQEFIRAAARAKQRLLNATAKRFDLEITQQLVMLCAELQAVWGNKPFPLPTRKAAEFLGVSSVAAWKHLNLMKFEGVLEEVSTGSKSSQKASEFRYTGER